MLNYWTPLSSICIVWCLMGPVAAQPQSLWEQRDPDRVRMFADTAARQVGDLVTVIVREATDVANRDQRALDKSSESNGDFDFNATGDLGSGSGTFNFGGKSDRNFSGQSQYSVEQEFADRITAQVVDILPNGNMVIAGRRRRQVAGEMRTLLVSGTVRARDISPANTVLSQNVANFRICYEGDGPETSYTKQGWASRLINKIWPF